MTLVQPKVSEASRELKFPRSCLKERSQVSSVQSSTLNRSLRSFPTARPVKRNAMSLVIESVKAQRTMRLDHECACGKNSENFKPRFHQVVGAFHGQEIFKVYYDGRLGSKNIQDSTFVIGVATFRTRLAAHSVWWNAHALVRNVNMTSNFVSWKFWNLSIFNIFQHVSLHLVQGTILAVTPQPSSHRHGGSAVVMAASWLFLSPTMPMWWPVF